MSSKILSSNGHTNGHTTNRISTTPHVETTGTLPTWENYATALIGSEILFSLAQDDNPELLADGSAERLKQHFDVKRWLTDAGSEKVLSVALEALLSRVDWNAIARHVRALAQVSAAE
jgi:hypothetical protein